MTTENIIIQVREDGAKVVKRNLDELGASGNTAGMGIQFLKRALLSLGAVMGIRELMQQVDTYTLLTNRLKLVTTGTENLRRIQEALYQSAQRTRGSYEGTVDLYSRVARNAKTLGLSQKEILDITESVNQAIRVSGTSAEEASAGITQLGQALGSGVLRGDELNSILENMPRLAQAIADGMDTTIGKLRKLGADGKLTSQAVVEALQKSAPTIAAEFAQLTPTIGEAFVVLRNSALKFIGQLNQSTGISTTFANILMTVAGNLDTVAKAAEAAAIAIALLFTVNTISSATIYIGQLMALERALGATTAATALLGVGLKAVQYAGMAAGAAIAAVGGPITIVIAAIAAIVAALYVFSDDIKVTSDGVVSLGDIFRTVFAYIGDAVGPVADWFKSVWTVAVAAVGKTFNVLYDVISSIVSGIVSIVKGYINIYIGAWVAAYRLVVAAWNNFGPAMKALGATAVNGLIDVVDTGITALVKGIGAFLDWLGTAFTSVGMDNPFEGMFKDFSTGLSDFKIQVDGDTAAIAEDLKGAFSTDYLGDAGAAFMERARQIADARTAIEKAGAGGEISSTPGQAAPADPGGKTGKLSDAQKRLKDMLEQIRGPMTDYEGNLKALDTLLASGKITVDEYSNAFRDLRITLLDTQTTLEAGVERSFLKIAKDAEDAATQIEDVITSAFSGATDALVDFVKTGKLDFSSLIDDMIGGIVKLALQQSVVAPLANALSGIIGGLFSSGASTDPWAGLRTVSAATGGNLSVGQTGIGFATAGDFTVPGSTGGVDNVPVNFMASPGEKVSVTRPGEAQRQGQTISQNVQVNVVGGGSDTKVEERKGTDGSKIVDVIIDRSRSATATDISKGGTDINRALETRYGLNPAVGNKT